MKFPKLRQRSTSRLRVPQLSGGVNLRDNVAMVEDNQLTQCNNMWWKDGALRGRPFFRLYNVVNTGSNAVPVVTKHLQIPNGCYALYYFSGSGGEADRVYFCGYSDDPDSDCFFDEVSFSGLDGVIPSTNDTGALPKPSFMFEHSPIKIGGAGIFVVWEDGTITELTRVGGNPKFKSLDIADVYAPIVAMNCRGDGSGNFFEEFNALGGGYRIWFTAEGNVSLMAPITIDPSAEIVLEYLNKNGEVSSLVWEGGSSQTMTMDEQDVIISFTLNTFYFQIADPPLRSFDFPEGIENNFRVTVRPRSMDGGTIAKMQICQWFGGDRSNISGGTRLFVAGNPNEPNILRWSAVNKPLYFPKDNCSAVGNVDNRITSLEKMSDILCIFKEREIYISEYVSGSNLTAEDVTSETVSGIQTYAAVFPLTQIHPSIGCSDPETIRLCNNRLVWYSTGTVYGLYGMDRSSERNVRILSGNIERAIPEDVAGAFEQDGHYILVSRDGKAYAMDFNASGFNYLTTYSADERAQDRLPWFLWQLPRTVSEIVPLENGAFLNSRLEDVATGTRAVAVYRLRDLWEDETGIGDHVLTGIGSDGKKITAYYPVNLLFQTKVFECDYPERLKAFSGAYLGIGGGGNVTVSLVTERGSFPESRTVFAGSDDEYSAPYISEQRFSQGVIRAKKFAVSFASSSVVCVDGIAIDYRMEGGHR